MAKKKESTAEETTETAEYKPSTAMIALFAPSKTIDATKLVRRNMPQMIKPGDVPLGAIVSGEIIRICQSPVSTVKGKLLWLKHESGTEFTFPCTGVIRNALIPGIKGPTDEMKDAERDAAEKTMTAALEKEIGKTFYAKRLESKPSKYKKEMFMFDVYTSNK